MLAIEYDNCGRLRCPSEPLSLKWEHVDWERGRLTVPSPKTERHENGACRVILIFPELLPHLEAVFEQAEPGGEFIITGYRDSGVNLRTQLSKIIRCAGPTQWPKLRHNLRASRQTELAESFPTHIVCAWIGNSLDVAREHYLQVTDQHFERALQNPVQQLHASDRNASQSELRSDREIASNPGDNKALRNLAELCETIGSSQNGRYWTRTSDPYRVRIVL